jgi:hypothetical protein
MTDLLCAWLLMVVIYYKTVHIHSICYVNLTEKRKKICIIKNFTWNKIMPSIQLTFIITSSEMVPALKSDYYRTISTLLFIKLCWFFYDIVPVLATLSHNPVISKVLQTFFTGPLIFKLLRFMDQCSYWHPCVLSLQYCCYTFERQLKTL